MIQFRKIATKVSLGSVAALAAGAAMADVPAGVTTAISSAGTDAATVGSAVLVVIVGIFAFKWIRRAL